MQLAYRERGADVGGPKACVLQPFGIRWVTRVVCQKGSLYLGMPRAAWRPRAEQTMVDVANALLQECMGPKLADAVGVDPAAANCLDVQTRRALSGLGGGSAALLAKHGRPVFAGTTPRLDFANRWLGFSSTLGLDAAWCCTCRHARAVALAASEVASGLHGLGLLDGMGAHLCPSVRAPLFKAPRRFSLMVLWSTTPWMRPPDKPLHLPISITLLGLGLLPGGAIAQKGQIPGLCRISQCLMAKA